MTKPQNGFYFARFIDRPDELTVVRVHDDTFYALAPTYNADKLDFREQLVMVGDGRYGTELGPHTVNLIERFDPAQLLTAAQEEKEGNQR